MPRLLRIDLLMKTWLPILTEGFIRDRKFIRHGFARAEEEIHEVTSRSSKLCGHPYLQTVQDLREEIPAAARQPPGFLIDLFVSYVVGVSVHLLPVPLRCSSKDVLMGCNCCVRLLSLVLGLGSI